MKLEQKGVGFLAKRSFWDWGLQLRKAEDARFGERLCTKGQTRFSCWEITVGDHLNCCDKEDSVNCTQPLLPGRTVSDREQEVRRGTKNQDSKWRQQRGHGGI